MIDAILARLNQLPKERRILAIDGRCAAGKTTLATALAEKTGAAVIHMDSFFPLPHQRTTEWEAVGGNVDHERFIAEVLEPLKTGQPFAYRHYDCASGNFSPVSLDPCELVIVEGAYSCHPLFSPAYDLKVFLTTSPDEQLRRIVNRNGPEKANLFQSRWIPMEEAYLERFGIPGICDLSFTT